MLLIICSSALLPVATCVVLLPMLLTRASVAMASAQIENFRFKQSSGAQMEYSWERMEGKIEY